MRTIAETRYAIHRQPCIAALEKYTLWSRYILCIQLIATLFVSRHRTWEIWQLGPVTTKQRLLAKSCKFLHKQYCNSAPHASKQIVLQLCSSCWQTNIIATLLLMLANKQYCNSAPHAGKPILLQLCSSCQHTNIIAALLLMLAYQYYCSTNPRASKQIVLQPCSPALLQIRIMLTHSRIWIQNTVDLKTGTKNICHSSNQIRSGCNCQISRSRFYPFYLSIY